MPTTAKMVRSSATIRSVLGPKIRHFRGKTTSETVFEASVRTILLVPKPGSHLGIWVTRSGRNGKGVGCPSAISATSIGAVPGALSRTMFRRGVGNVLPAKVPAKKTTSHLAKTFPRMGTT
jgi:hypothetical protein